MEELLWLLGWFAGMFFGWVVSAWFKDKRIKELTKEILTMRMTGFDPSPRLQQSVDSAQQDDPTVYNET